jgi:DNA-binding response OmpR family regulator
VSERSFGFVFPYNRRSRSNLIVGTSVTHILVIEDNLDITEMLNELLSEEGHEVTCVRDGESGLRAMTSKISLVILDIGLPGIQGWAVLSIFRRVTSVPILILSAQDEWEKRVKGLKSGADDYMTKPFQPEELVARIEALLRRIPERPEQPIIEFNPSCRMLTINAVGYRLTERECMVLKVLAEEPSRVFSRDELLLLAWQESSHENNIRKVDLCMSRLRNKLHRLDQPELVESVFRLGYTISLKVLMI